MGLQNDIDRFMISTKICRAISTPRGSTSEAVMHLRRSCILSTLSKKGLCEHARLARGSEDRESFVSSRRASTMFFCFSRLRCLLFRCLRHFLARKKWKRRMEVSHYIFKAILIHRTFLLFSGKRIDYSWTLSFAAISRALLEDEMIYMVWLFICHCDHIWAPMATGEYMG